MKAYFTLAITGNVGQEALIIVDEDVEQKPSNTQASTEIY